MNNYKIKDIIKIIIFINKCVYEGDKYCRNKYTLIPIYHTFYINT